MSPTLSSQVPSLQTELALLERYEKVIALDEVGRGALAGPVAIGAAVFTRQTDLTIPKGLKDSKLIAEGKRDDVATRSASWVETTAGFVSASEIEAIGISRALQLAAIRALENLDLENAVILLDGTHNFLKDQVPVQVVTQVKADRDCASVSAAAIWAKVQRDNQMRQMHQAFQAYGFEKNKGYASPDHITALQSVGPCAEHRHSWLTKILQTELF